MRTWAMAMGFLVAPDRKLRHMREHGAARHMNVHVARALAAFFSRHEIDLADIGDEIGMKYAAVIFGEILSFF